MNVQNEMNTVKDLVMSILSEDLYARNDDTYLYQKCCEKLGGKQISDITKIGLSVVTVHKIRQKIQNQEKKFLPTEEVKNKRKKRSIEIRDYMINN